MAALKAERNQLGPMPIDPSIQEKLMRVKFDNNFDASDERVWMERSEKYAESFATSEVEFFAELDKRML